MSNKTTIKCRVCGRYFNEGDNVIPILKVVSRKYRDEVTGQAEAWACLRHLTECQAMQVIG